jgi:hypothetical protein
VYYLVLREGTGVSPCNVDGVWHPINYLETEIVSNVSSLATRFEEKYPQQMISLFSTIKGWSEIFPQFKTGTSKANDADGTVTH